MSLIYAQAASPSFLEQMFPFILIIGVFYLIFIRPQAKQRKEHIKFLSEMKRGDDVITMSGFLGKIEGLTDKFITLEIASGVKVKILKNQIAGPLKGEKK